MVVVKFRERPADPGDRWHVEVQVFTGHGSQSNPEDITCGLAGTLVMDRSEWEALQSRLRQVGPDNRYSVTFMEARS